MPYASLNDLIERAGPDEILQVADRDDDGVPDQDVIEAALVHADNTVNGYVATIYRVPLATVPDLVRTWAVSIARYFLHRDGAPDHVASDRKDAIAALKDVAAGRITLQIDQGADPLQPSAGGKVSVVGPEPAFSADKMEGWL